MLMLRENTSIWNTLHAFSEYNRTKMDFIQGRLTIGAALLGSRHVIGVDIDEAALDTCQENLNDFDDLPVSISMPSCKALRFQNIPLAFSPHISCVKAASSARLYH